VRFAPIILACSLVACACDDTQTRNEAMLFIDRFEDVDVDDPLEERRTAIDGIRHLVLRDPTVSAARDQCVSAYDALIEAEDQHGLARHLLVGTFLPDGGEVPVPPDLAAQINGAIEHSDEAIARSRELFPRCTRAVGQLERRFPRHASTH
jgi:hypothetical protein